MMPLATIDRLCASVKAFRNAYGHPPATVTMSPLAAAELGQQLDMKGRLTEVVGMRVIEDETLSPRQSFVLDDESVVLR